jgi:hypothetical protein
MERLGIRTLAGLVHFGIRNNLLPAASELAKGNRA